MMLKMVYTRHRVRSPEHIQTPLAGLNFSDRFLKLFIHDNPDDMDAMGYGDSDDNDDDSFDYNSDDN